MPTVPLTIDRPGTGTGKVTATGLSCPGGAATQALPCGASYPLRTARTLTAVPDPGSSFAGWGGACSGTGTCQVTLSMARYVTASFTKLPATSDTRGAVLIKAGEHRGRRGARPARREEGEYQAVFDRRATPRDGMDRRPNAGGIDETGSGYHTDPIGSVRAITDETGAVVIRHDYRPFGEDVQPLTGDPMRFAGEESDIIVDVSIATFPLPNEEQHPKPAYRFDFNDLVSVMRE